ncbi:DUF4349 domain-containing protein [Neolewinella lacunae]|uniref:DUF4349 domain-containing protein n=1 Tax=Neolewinella lacunae TaxID=1517758 RepID=A0A923T626_9BACT|nr:DUF4349 domain-containing protein [Neolewinella lacunae]MBC6992965.1 DUF4349 domain-containing protein [Neolewinella lacunae]MDN3633896.1 DUF4349 domain-containing protein [Neolewinella lacunae]
MKVHLLLLALLLGTFLCTCGSAGDSASEGMRPSMEEYARTEASPEMDRSTADAPESEAIPQPSAPNNAGRDAAKIIYTAEVRARVEHLDSALARITRRVNESGGYLASQFRNNSPYEHTATLQIRLPAERLNPTLAYLPTLAAQIDHQNLSSQDVTAEWLDLESRLQTKRDVRDRYIEILRNRAQKVEDILNAEEKIRVITEEIEAKEGQLRYLRDQVSLSTLTLTLYETQEYRPTGEAYQRSFGSKLRSSLAMGWELIQSLVLGLVSIWPLLLLGGIGAWFFRRWRSKRSAK